MKRTCSLSTTTIALLISSCFAAPAVFAQAAPPAPLVSDSPGAPPPPDARPPRDARGPRASLPAPPRNDAAAQATITGRVARLLQNPNGDVDGLLLDDGTQVATPPHLSSQMLAAVKPRDNVSITGWRAPNAAVIRATQVRNTASSRSVTDEGPGDTAPPPPQQRPALAPMNAGGRIAVLLHSDRGDINGVVLDSGTSVRFPPQVATQFDGLLKTGGTLYAQGYGTSNGQGSTLEATRLGASRDAQQAVFAPPRGPAGDRADGPPVPPVRPDPSAPRPADDNVR